MSQGKRVRDSRRQLSDEEVAAVVHGVEDLVGALRENRALLNPPANATPEQRRVSARLALLMVAEFIMDMTESEAEARPFHALSAALDDLDRGTVAPIFELTSKGRPALSTDTWLVKCHLAASIEALTRLNMTRAEAVRDLLSRERASIAVILGKGTGTTTQQLIALHKDFAKQEGGARERIPLLSTAWATYVMEIDCATALPTPMREPALRSISKHAIDAATKRWHALPVVGR